MPLTDSQDSWKKFISQQAKEAKEKATGQEAAASSDFNGYQRYRTTSETKASPNKSTAGKQTFQFREGYNPFAQEQNNIKENIEFLKEFAAKLEHGLGNIDLDSASLNPQQRWIMAKLKDRAKIRQYIEMLAAAEIANRIIPTNEAEALAQQNLKLKLKEEIAKDFFVIACALDIDLALEFKNQALEKGIISDADESDL